MPAVIEMSDAGECPRSENLSTLPMTQHACIEFSFGRYDFYERHLVSRIRRGVELGHAEFDKIISAIRDHYGDRRFGYMSVRREDYSVNPLASRRVIAETSVVAGAFIVPDERARLIFSTEKLFYNVPTLACHTEEEGLAFLSGYLL